MGVKIMFWGADEMVVLVVAFSEVIGFPVHQSHLCHPASLGAVIVGEVADLWREVRWRSGAWD
jgi:hypothetical protein